MKQIDLNTKKIKDIEKKILAPGIVVYKNIFLDSLEILELIEAKNLWCPGEAAMSRYKKDGYENHRDVDVFEIGSEVGVSDLNFTADETKKYTKAAADLHRLSSYCLSDYVSIYGIDTLEGVISDYQILKYSLGQAFSEHTDEIPENKRTISTILYLNDDYEGGELRFTKFGLTHRPTRGDYIVFPSMWSYSHVAQGVTKGTKYAIVSFVF